MEQLTRFLKEATWPLPADQWPESANTNCLAFALGLPYDDADTMLFGKLGRWSNTTNSCNPGYRFQHDCWALGLECRELTSEEEALPGEILIKVYGFYPESTFHARMGIFEDFHVIRRDWDGVWYHKPGWDLSPREVDWTEFRKEYPDREIKGIYAIMRKE